MITTIDRIANTIVANLENTNNYGLINGKSGLCVFMFEYARYSKKSSYKLLAHQLLYDIYLSNKKELPYGINNGIEGIGLALCRIQNAGYAPTEMNNIIDDIDNLIFRNTYRSLKQDYLYASEYFSAGIYLITRMKLSTKAIDHYLIEEFLRNTERFFKEYEHQPFVGKEELIKSARRIFEKSKAFFSKNLSTFQSILDIVSTLEVNNDTIDYLNDIPEEESLTESLWKDFIYDKKTISNSCYIDVVETLIKQYPYRLGDINNKLAIIGIRLIQEGTV